MGTLELLIIAVSLSMDAFAVAVCKGLSVKQLKLRQALIVGLYFGGFQALMPLLGWLLGVRFQEMIASVDHWIAFALLASIGANMIKSSKSKDDDDMNDLFTVKVMLPLAIATSIDALTVGIAFAFLKVNIVAAVITIGVITFILSCAGTKIGNVFGSKYKSKAEFFGGVVLICLGLKILLEHLGVF